LNPTPKWIEDESIAIASVENDVGQKRQPLAGGVSIKIVESPLSERIHARIFPNISAITFLSDTEIVHMTTFTNLMHENELVPGFYKMSPSTVVLNPNA
jgi:hypothetical protein